MGAVTFSKKTNEIIAEAELTNRVFAGIEIAEVHYKNYQGGTCCVVRNAKRSINPLDIMSERMKLLAENRGSTILRGFWEAVKFSPVRYRCSYEEIELAKDCKPSNRTLRSP